MSEDRTRAGETPPAAEAPGPSLEDAKPRVFVVGLGQSGRELVYSLMDHVPVVGIDLVAKKVELVEGRGAGAGVKAVARDGTSRLTWRELGLLDRDLVVTVTRSDVVNLEVCRIVREHFQVRQIISLIHASSRESEYHAVGVETLDRAKVLAAYLSSRVLKDRRTAQNVGLGQGEIMEVSILQGSQVIGRQLRSFHAPPWLVGAVYRHDQLIVPHGLTTIEEGDRVVLIGEPHVLASVADYFKMGEPEFPLQYGSRIGIVCGSAKDKDKEQEALLTESNYLAGNTRAVKMVLLTRPGSPEPDVETADRICEGAGLTCEPAYLADEEHTEWPKTLQQNDFGCLVMGDRQTGLLRRLGVLSSLLLKVLEEANFPLLISRGTHPYKKILVPVTLKSSPLRVSQLAINLARLFSARLDAVTVTEPAFAAGDETVSEQQKVLDQILEFSSLYRLPINVIRREGNPIQEIVEQARDYNLIVMGHRQGVRRWLPHLDMALEIMARSACSVMILPFHGDDV